MITGRRLIVASMLLGSCLMMSSAQQGAVSALREDPASPHPHGGHHAQVIAACLRECESCSDHCARLLESGRKEHLSSQRICRDCAELCSAALRIVARDGPLCELATQACAKACDLCATECERFSNDDQMKQCAKICRECAQVCRGITTKLGASGR
jgi:hypothetical protein